MKLGVITDCFKKTHEYGIEKAAQLGLDGVQIYATTGDFSPALSDAQKTGYKTLLNERGLVVSALCGDMGGFGFEIEQDNHDRVEKTKKIIDLAVEFGAKAVTTHISNLRRKLKTAPDVPEYIRSVRGVGYKFDVPN